MDLSMIREVLNRFLPAVLTTLAVATAIQFIGPSSKQVSMFLTYVFWGASLFFAARLVVEYRASDDIEEFMRAHWLDFLLVVPAFSAAKELKLVSMMRNLSLETEFLVGASSLRGISSATRAGKLVRIVRRILDI